MARRNTGRSVERHQGFPKMGSRFGRGCDSRDWRHSIEWAFDKSWVINGGASLANEIDDLLYAHSRDLARLHWHVPLYTTVTNVSRRLHIRTLCTTGQRLSTRITAR